MTAPRKAAAPRKKAPPRGGEKQLQTTITKALVAYWYHPQHVYRLRTEDGNWRTSTPAVGWPDLVALGGPQGMWLLAIEVKGHRTPIDDAQLVWLARFASLPCCRAWVLRPTDQPADWHAWMRNPQAAPRRHGWTQQQAQAAATRLADKPKRGARKPTGLGSSPVAPSTRRNP